MKALSSALFVGVICCALSLPVSAGASNFKVVHAFDGTDGDYPASGVINVKGLLYGTTELGGAQFYGAVFSLDPTTGAEKVIYSFCKHNKCPNGEFPLGGLISVNGILYGTTEAGGAYNSGTVFSLDPRSGKETILHSFDCGADGCEPVAGLIDMKDTLYGTAPGGGTGTGGGAVFAIDVATGSFSTVYDFCSQTNCADGLGPDGAVLDANGILYGTTASGGTWQNGTVYSLDPATGTETVVYSFCKRRNCPDGAAPQSALLDVNGILYGTTSAGGVKNSNWGTVFALDLSTGAETVLHSFCSESHCRDGALPYAGLISAKGTLYGTTTLGGSDTSCDAHVGCGVVYALDPQTGTETVLHSFHNDSTDGGYVIGGVIDVGGTLYGTATSGGIGYGTVFSLEEP